MTETTFGDVDLCNWLVANLCARLGCEADEIDLEASLKDVESARETHSSCPVNWPSSWVVRSHRWTVGETRPSTHLSRSSPRGQDSFADSADEAAMTTDRRSLDEPIAVVGLGCRLPGGITAPEELWQFLLGTDNVRSARSRPSAGSRSTTARLKRPPCFPTPPDGLVPRRR